MGGPGHRYGRDDVGEGYKYIQKLGRRYDVLEKRTSPKGEIVDEFYCTCKDELIAEEIVQAQNGLGDWWSWKLDKAGKRVYY